jgi:hypothetical protein
MHPESQITALIVVLSAVFESLPPKARRRAERLVEKSLDLTDDRDARRLMATYTPLDGA